MITYFVKAPGILGGDRKKADDMAEEIARIDPGAGYLARVQVLRDTKSDGDFETLFRQAAETSKIPDVKYDATTSLVNWYFSQKPPRYDAAEQQSRALVKLDPHRITGYRGLAVVYATAARWPELDAVLADSEKNVPDNLTPHYRAASTTIADGNDFPRAERYSAAISRRSRKARTRRLAQAHWRLGNALEKEGRRADAIAEIEQATKLKPDLEDAKKDLVRIRASR